MINYKTNWNETKQMFDSWFAGKPTHRPLIKVFGKRDKPVHELLEEEAYSSYEDIYCNMKKGLERKRNFLSLYEPLGEAFPHTCADLGAGTMALYLGSEPIFTKETVWFKECMKDYSSLPLKFDPDNYWFKRHIELIKEQIDLASDTDILCAIPDLVENIDILSAMRGPQEACFDLYDYPDEMKQAINQINDVYFKCYDKMYDILKTKDGYSSYMFFDILGKGKTVKVQCDMSAMLSADQFREFVLPSLKQQAQRHDNVLFHLDGRECWQHVPALLEIENLAAIQWTTGDGNPVAGDECWYPLYKQIRDAGKGLWLDLRGKTPIEDADKIVKTFGPESLYLLFDSMPMDDAMRLMRKAETDWKY